MSDAQVARAIQEQIKRYEEQIRKNVYLQYHIVEMMLEGGITDHALWSMTSRYKEFDREIGQARTLIRNLIADN